MGRVIRAADLFCGAGGSSTGLAQICAELGYTLDLTAVNHWDRAIETHAANHPSARHINKRIEQIRPEGVIPGGRLDLLWASPECTYHSNARGGGPCNDQSRSQAMLVLDWVDRCRPSTVVIENVPEFTNWGPLYRSGKQKGRPIRVKRGQQFAAWLAMLSAMNYRFDWQLLTCANYGDPTSRRRFFLIARRGRRRVTWPTPTHTKSADPNMFGDIPQWRPASEVIDWTIPGHSIFLSRDEVKGSGVNIRRPLRPNTLRRIEAGSRKFWGAWAEPFLVHLRGTSDSQIEGSPIRIDTPLPTLTAGGGHVGLVQPFCVSYHNSHPGKKDGDQRTISLDSPLPVQDTSNRYGLLRPMLVRLTHRGNGAASVVDLARPVPTVTTAKGGEFALMQPWILHQNSPGRNRGVGEPIPTLTTISGHALVRPCLGK